MGAFKNISLEEQIDSYGNYEENIEYKLNYNNMNFLEKNKIDNFLASDMNHLLNEVLLELTKNSELLDVVADRLMGISKLLDQDKKEIMEYVNSNDIDNLVSFIKEVEVTLKEIKKEKIIHKVMDIGSKFGFSSEENTEEDMRKYTRKLLGLV